MILHALVVDPSSARTRMYRDVLGEEGLEVFVVHDGYQACKYLESAKPICLLVTELSLSRIDGFGVLRRLQRSPSAGIPVLVVSAFRELRATAMNLRDELGISALLPASARPDLLRQVVERLLQGEDEIVAEEAVLTSIEEGEVQRLASIERARVTAQDPVADEELTAIARGIASQLNVPVALVSIVLRDRQWFKARVGTELAGTPLELSFCRHVVAARDTLIIPDAWEHPTFAAAPLVKDGTVRGYAGVPLIGSDGQAWGALCVIHPTEPIVLNTRDLDKLVTAARQVVARIEERGANVRGSIGAPPG